jgi:anthranilate synthase component 2
VKSILLVDNYDSFVFNLKSLCESLEGVCITVMRNDDPFIELLYQDKFDGLIISPGPGSPDDTNYFGQCMAAIKEVGPVKKLPIFGVCLGFQGIAYAFGCSLKRAVLPMHGKVSSLKIIEPGVTLRGVHSGSKVMRYHSLMIDMEQAFSSELKITAEVHPSEMSTQKNGREVMAVEHRTLPIYGVQYHPESFATELGRDMMENFVASICR